MPNGKIRHANHIIDQRACQYLQRTLPQEWVQRPISPDYGLDVDLELFGFENGKCITLGEHVYLQIKGTELPKFDTLTPTDKRLGIELENELSVLKFNIDVPILNLVERMGSAIPVLLVVVDLANEKPYYVCLNDYIRYVLPYQNPNFRSQNNVIIYIPQDNILTEHDSKACLWYGKRAKLYSLFQEFISITETIKGLSVYEIVDEIERFINRIIDHDAWSLRHLWTPLQDLYLIISELKENNMIIENHNIVYHTITKDQDVFKTNVICGDKECVSAFTAMRYFSGTNFLDKALLLASIYEDYARHLGLPSKLL